MRYLVAVSIGPYPRGDLFRSFEALESAQAYAQGLEDGARAFSHDLVAVVVTREDVAHLVRYRDEGWVDNARDIYRLHTAAVLYVAQALRA